MRSRRLAAVAISALAGTATASIALAPGAHAAAETPHSTAAPLPAAAPISVGKVYVAADGGSYKGEPTNPLPALYASDGSAIHLPSQQASHIQFSPDGSRILYMDE